MEVHWFPPFMRSASVMVMTRKAAVNDLMLFITQKVFSLSKGVLYRYLTRFHSTAIHLSISAHTGLELRQGQDLEDGFERKSNQIEVSESISSRNHWREANLRDRGAGAQKQSIFLAKTPRELRDMIFNYVVVFEKPLRPDPIAEIKWGTQKGISRIVNTVEYYNRRELIRIPTSPVNLSIFRVNKQVYTESRDVFLKRNEFKFSLERFEEGFQLRLMDFMHKRLFQEAAPKVLNLTPDVGDYRDLALAAKHLIRENDFNSLTIRLNVSSTILEGKTRNHFRATMELLRHIRVKGAAKILLKIDVAFISTSGAGFNSHPEDLPPLLASIKMDMVPNKPVETHLKDQAKKSIDYVLAP